MACGGLERGSLAGPVPPRTRQAFKALETVEVAQGSRLRKVGVCGSGSALLNHPGRFFQGRLWLEDPF